MFWRPGEKDWIVTLFDSEIENTDIESHLEDELIDTCNWSQS